VPHGHGLGLGDDEADIERLAVVVNTPVIPPQVWRAPMQASLSPLSDFSAKGLSQCLGDTEPRVRRAGVDPSAIRGTTLKNGVAQR